MDQLDPEKRLILELMPFGVEKILSPEIWLSHKAILERQAFLGHPIQQMLWRLTRGFGGGEDPASRTVIPVRLGGGIHQNHPASRRVIFYFPVLQTRIAPSKPASRRKALCGFGSSGKGALCGFGSDGQG